MGKGKKELKKRPSEFSTRDKVLITATSVVAFGGVVFCGIMIFLMTHITY